jgi:prevent-host-death family protein
MAVLHISATEAARNFTALMARVRAGEKIVIEDDSSPIAVLQPIVAEHVRLLSESLRLAKKHASRATLDGDFERDLEAVINSHPEPLAKPWDRFRIPAS